MATNPYINLLTRTDEQDLLSDLMVEAIQIHGLDIRYMPRTFVNRDELFGEDPLSKFEDAYEVEAYIVDAQGFGGVGETMNKFGLHINDTLRLQIARARFTEAVSDDGGPARPMEGDIIWVAAPHNSFFEIQFVEDERPFWQLGKLVVWELHCEKLRYSSERVETGNTDIDNAAATFSSSQVLSLGSGSGTFTVGETIYQGPSSILPLGTGVVVQANSVAVVIKDITGSFMANSAIVGMDSGASYTLTNVDLNDLPNDGEADNKYIETQSDSILDFSETNPFGEF